MKNKKNLSILVAFAMLFNLFVFPVSAGASTLDNNTVYAVEGDTNSASTKAPETKNRTVLDIAQGSISITSTSVTGITPGGTAATVNPNGYEITGSTETNQIVVNDAVPITINNLNIDYNADNIIGGARAINMVNGGEITVRGTNTMNRVAQSTSMSNYYPFIGQEDAVLLKIIGDGTLNMTDGANGATIGAEESRIANIEIAGDVTINAQKLNQTDSPVIGGYIPTIRITENAKVNASLNGAGSTASVIGGTQYSALVNITISGKAEVTARVAEVNSNVSALGAGAGSSSEVTIRIENEPRVKLDNASTATVSDALGMGLPLNASLSLWLDMRSKIYVGNSANIDAPGRENYYKSRIDSTSPVYKATASGLMPNAMVVVQYKNNTTSIKTQDDGTISLYLAVGTQNLIIDGVRFEGKVDTSGNSILIGRNALRAANIEQELGDTKSLDLTGHATSTAQSQGAITYTITDAGTTGATLTGNTLNWTSTGTAVLKASQVAEGKHDPAVTTFNLVVTKPKRGVLDISKAPITITSTSVTAKTINGTDAAFNPNGYEIVGSTETNQIAVNDAVPITINGVTVDYKTDRLGTAINMLDGGEITVTGTNTINRVTQGSFTSALIAQNSGILAITGDGILNITDRDTNGNTIGANKSKPANVHIAGDVTINATRGASAGTVIGGGNGTNNNTTVVITENAKINASVNGITRIPVIGDSTGATGIVDITISGKAQVVANGGTEGSQGAIIGTGYPQRNIANITIEDGTYVKATLRSTDPYSDASGIGIPTRAKITDDMIARSKIKVSSFANVEAPARESYYKSLNGTTPVYKTTASGLTPNAIVDVTQGGKTVPLKTHADGTLNLYLPLGVQDVTIAGTDLAANVNTNGTAIIGLSNILIAPDIVTTVNAGNVGVDLIGYATSSGPSTGAITYDLMDAGTTRVRLQGGSGLYWSATGTAVLKASQAAAGGYIPAETIFNLIVSGPVIDNKRGVLDISKAPITITSTSVTAKAINGTDAEFDPDGYEIVGSTETNQIVVNDAVPITINGITLDYKTDTIGTAIQMVGGGEITVAGTNAINRLQFPGNRALIEQTSGTINFTGTGTLNITDEATVGATIGDSNGNQTVNVNIKSGANINIDKNGAGAAIGTTNEGSAGAANITIEDGTRVNISNKVATNMYNSVGMGLAAGMPITSEILARTKVKVSSFANINAPVGENYYKDLAGTTPVYKTTVAYTVTPDAMVDVTHGGKTVQVKANADGTMNLYLPLGEQKVNIAGTELVGTVDASGNTQLMIDPLLAVADLSVHASKGIQGVNLSGSATSNSSGAITYTLLNAGNTGAKLNGTVLNWNMPGTVRMNAVQEANGNYTAASTEFAVNITTNPGDVHVNVSVDVNSAGWGSIAVINKNNEEIIPFVPVGEEITLKATADKGYKLKKWVKTTTTRAITAEDLPAVTDFKITAQAGVGYVAHFAVKEISPKLDILEVSSMVIQPDGTTKEKYKPLIRQDGTEDVLFNSQKLEYGLYLRSVDTNDINIYTLHSDSKPLNIKVDNEPGVDVEPFIRYKVSLKLNGGAYQEIPVLVDDGVDQTRYLIKVFKVQKTENDPHIYSELEINPIKEVLELGIYAMNIDVNSFSMTIKMDDLLTADKKAFSAFSNKKGVEFNDLSVNLAGSLENYFNLDSRFQIADMRSNGQFISVTVTRKTTDGVVTNSIKFEDKPEKILSINVKRSKAYKGSVIDEIDTLKMEPVQIANSTYGNNLSSKFYGDINDTFQSNRVEDEKTLSYLVFKGKFDTIKMYVTYDSNLVGRVQFEIIDVSVPNNRQVVASGDVVDQEIQERVIQSTYRVRVISGGYLLAESEDIVYDGEPSKYGIIMTPVTLLEGDLDENDLINGADRTKLITVLNKNVVVEGSGFVELGSDKIYADYNDDNHINSLDLGRLVQNIGKQYGIISRN